MCQLLILFKNLLFACYTAAFQGNCVTLNVKCMCGDKGCGVWSGVVGGIVVALLLALCICFLVRRKRNKQVGEKRVAAKKEKQQKEKKASGPWLGLLRRRKRGGPGGTGTPHPLPCSSVFMVSFCYFLGQPWRAVTQIIS